MLPGNRKSTAAGRCSWGHSPGRPPPLSSSSSSSGSSPQASRRLHELLSCRFSDAEVCGQEGRGLDERRRRRRMLRRRRPAACIPRAPLTLRMSSRDTWASRSSSSSIQERWWCCAISAPDELGAASGERWSASGGTAATAPAPWAAAFRHPAPRRPGQPPHRLQSAAGRGQRRSRTWLCCARAFAVGSAIRELRAALEHVQNAVRVN